jgi:hypothetical protein
MAPKVFTQHAWRMLLVVCMVLGMKVCAHSQIILFEYPFSTLVTDQLLMDHYCRALTLFPIRPAMKHQVQILTVIYANLALQLERLYMLCLETRQQGYIITGIHLYLIDYRRNSHYVEGCL